MRTVVFITLILFNSLLLAQKNADMYVVRGHGGRSAIFSIGNNRIITELTDNIHWVSVIDFTSILVRREHSNELWEPDFNYCLFSNATDYMYDLNYGFNYV